jgi:hypothetical protein
VKPFITAILLGGSEKGDSLVCRHEAQFLQSSPDGSDGSPMLRGNDFEWLTANEFIPELPLLFVTP